MDPQLIGTALAALTGVLFLILLLARGLRRLGWAPASSGAGTRRLAVEEALPLDGRRRLLLLRCDGRPLLLLTGGPQDVLMPLPPSAEAG
jgi:flagellar protein FliO/FliZ